MLNADGADRRVIIQQQIRQQIRWYIQQAKTTWNSTEQDVLAARQQVAAIDRK